MTAHERPSDLRITLVISSLACGGAERVAAVMANHWQATGWSVSLLTFDDGSEPGFYDLDPRVCHTPLGIAEQSDSVLDGVRNNLRRISKLRSAIRDSRPDAVISFMDTTNVITVLATRGLGAPVLVTEHMDPSMYPLGVVWERLRQLAYTAATRIVVLTQRSADYFAGQARLEVIPNPVLRPSENGAPVANALSRPSLIAIGRLTHQKGFDILLRAFAGIKEHHPQWSLTILGEGPLRDELEALRDELGLTGRVHLPGRVRNPYDYLRGADLFVGPSRFEGFFLALGEAMACGLPVIAADCRSGPREIIRDGIDGVLVPVEDVAALASAMDRLMRDERERQGLARHAPEVLERFGVEKVMRMWEELLSEVLKERSRS